MKVKLLKRIEENIRVQESKVAKEIGRYPYFKLVESASEPVIVIEGHKRINLGSNNYLGLTSDPSILEHSIEVLKEFGTGFTGSRLLNGSSVLHEKLEEQIAQLYQAEDALVFPTGYTSNLGFLSNVLHRSDVVLVDEEIHASLWDGLLLSRCKVKRFHHNNPEHFEKLVLANEGKIAMCIIEGVYSMNGDIGAVDKFAQICQKHNIFLFVDEAHGVGVLGKRGTGGSEHHQVLDQVDMFSITFSKSLASCGGALIGKKEILQSVKINSRPFLFTASNTPASLATASKALELMQKNPQWIEELQAKAKYFRDGLKEIGVVFSHHGITPIVPVLIGEDFRVLQAWKVLWNNGIFCNPVLSPAVAKGKGLLRFSVMRIHSYEMIDKVIEVIQTRILPMIKIEQN